MDNFKEIERIESYLLGNLDEQAQQEFEKEMAADAALQEEVLFHQYILKGIQKGEDKALKTAINQTTNKLEAGGFFNEYDLRNELASQNKKGKSSSDLKNLWWGILLFLLLSFFYWLISSNFFTPPNPPEEVKETKLPDPMPPSLPDADTISYPVAESEITPKPEKKRSVSKKPKEINQTTITNSKPVEASNSTLIASANLKIEDYIQYLPKERTRSVSQEPSLLDKANRAFDNRDFEVAYSYYTSLEAPQKENAAILYKLGFSALLIDKLDIAISAFNQVIKKQSISYKEDAEWHLALALYQKGKKLEANEMVKNIRKDPEHRLYKKAKLYLEDLKK